MKTGMGMNLDTMKHRIMRKYLLWFPAGGRILDVGSGDGDFLDLLKNDCFIGEGVDSDASKVFKTRSRGLTVFLSDAKEFIRHKVSKYDGIFCSNFLEHFQPADVTDFLGLFRTALKPGGRLIIVGPNPRSLRMVTETFWIDPTHVRFYPNRFFHDVLVPMGFDVLESGDDVETRFRRLPNVIASTLAVVKKVMRWLGTGYIFEGDEIYMVAEKR